MGISFNKIALTDSENVYIFYDRAADVRAIIAIHSTALGPAIGGCRMLPYGTEEEALDDVSRLARSMTYKSALANVNYGGGKSVILASESDQDRSQIFRAFGRFVDSLSGNYITAIDSGTTMEDMKTVSSVTSYVTGYNDQKHNDQNNCFSNPSYYTAKGVMESLLAAVEFKHGCNNLHDKKIFVKGVGSVGSFMVKFLKERGAEVYITDIDTQKVKTCSQKMGAIPLMAKDMYSLDFDILCPCDVNYTITEDNIRNISANIIVGATNNQLETDSLAQDLLMRDILYCPDYVANSGGLMYVTDLYEGNPLEGINQKLNGIHDTTMEVFRLSERNKISTKEAADLLAETKIKESSVQNLKISA